MSAYAERANNFHLAVAGVIAVAIAAALVALGSQRTDAPIQLDRFKPTGSLSDFPTVVQPQSEARPVLPQVAPQRSSGRTAPQVVQQPPEPVAQPQADPGGADVAIQNGTSDTKTESGGASTTNSAEMRVRSGSDFEEEEDTGP